MERGHQPASGTGKCNYIFINTLRWNVGGAATLRRFCQAEHQAALIGWKMHLFVQILADSAKRNPLSKHLGLVLNSQRSVLLANLLTLNGLYTRSQGQLTFCTTKQGELVKKDNDPPPNTYVFFLPKRLAHAIAHRGTGI